MCLSLLLFRTALVASAMLLLLRGSLGFLSASELHGEDSEIHRACRNGSLDIIKQLLDGSDASSVLEQRGVGGQPPLLAAVVAGHYEVVSYLLDRGADVSCTDADGYNSAHAAAFHGHAKLIRLLSRKGLDVNEMHFDGYAPIHRAAWGMQRRHSDTINSIVKATRGAAAAMRLLDGRTALDITSNKDSARLLRKLQRKTSKNFSLQYWAFLFPLAVLLVAFLMGRRIRGKATDKRQEQPQDRPGRGPNPSKDSYSKIGPPIDFMARLKRE